MDPNNNGDGVPTPTPPPETPPASANIEDTEQGGTTPDEVAKVLGSQGIHVSPQNVPDKDDVDDDENPDDDPNKPPAGDETPPAPKEATPPPAPVATPPAPKEEKPVETPAPVAREFTMEVEDAAGVTHKINADDDIEEALKDFDPKNNGQIFKILDQFRDLKDEKATYEKDQAAESETAARDERVAKLQEGWNSEVTDLQAAGRMPKVEAEREARVSAVYAHMGEENKERIAKDRPTINSFEDALNSLERKEAADAKVEAAKAAKDTARKNGALVGGSSAPAGNRAPVYQANGGAQTGQAALKQMGIL